MGEVCLDLLRITCQAILEALANPGVRVVIEKPETGEDAYIEYQDGVLIACRKRIAGYDDCANATHLIEACLKGTGGDRR